jgi:spore germination protein
MKRVTLGVLVCALLVLVSVQVASAAPASTCGVTHIVRRGQNLYRISLRYGVSMRAIARANGIANPNRIYTGQRLYIPCRSTYPAGVRTIHIVRRGETLASIARWYGTTVRAIMRANNIRNPNIIYRGQRLVIPGKRAPAVARGTWYKVRRGDTLSGIAYRAGVSVWSIAYANNIAYPSYIYTGQWLWIP